MLFKLETNDGDPLTVTALVVPLICHPLSRQPILQSREQYAHLTHLNLADSADVCDSLEVDLLIGSDVYWKLVTGRIARGRSGPTAMHTKVGWVLSGPVQCPQASVNLTFCSMHALMIESPPNILKLDKQLSHFWELESLGVAENESPVAEKFSQQITFNGERYSVALPWKENHPPLPNHFDLCRKRLQGLLRRLKQNPLLLKDYHAIIKDQIDNGIVEVVDNPITGTDRTHYLPHHCVIRCDKSTTKVRVVYDASARTDGPSLNDCLYVGPKSGQSVFDILVRFRLHKIVLAGDIEKAFLMVGVDERDRDSLRFLWTLNPEDNEPEIVTLRFARVAFGVASSPFLLNATIKHHMELYCDCDPHFVKKFMSSIYVDDVSLGSSNVDDVFELYLKSKTRLIEAGFKLRKFVTNLSELRHRIELCELLEPVNSSNSVTDEDNREDDQSYAKSTLGGRTDVIQKEHRILGIQWLVDSDLFSFDIREVYRLLSTVQPTKRNVVGMSARFYDPLGIMSPVTVQFKIFFQQLCKAKVDWDNILTGDLLKKWEKLCNSVKNCDVLVVPRFYFKGVKTPVRSSKLVGFCNASAKAYAAVVYLRVEADHQVHVRFVCAKTRVAPLTDISIPRLELLSALLLAKLITSTKTALETETSLEDSICYSDSKVALFWIQGQAQSWKQFVQNRVVVIRSLVCAELCRHCPGKTNPADILSRGTSATELVENPLWLYGPDFLRSSQEPVEVADIEPLDSFLSIPEECQLEMRQSVLQHLLTVTHNGEPCVGNLIDCCEFSSLHRLLKVTALVIQFVYLLFSKIRVSRCQSSEYTPDMSDSFSRARLLWIREAQVNLAKHPRFSQWKHQFGLFLDDSKVWRCGGRMHNADLPSEAVTPILLDKSHRLAELIVTEAHQRVQHSGVKATLTEVRSRYWLVKGRQFVRNLIYKCVTCRRLKGRPYSSIPPPPLPDFRVKQSRPFICTGVDFAGPMYVKDHDTTGGEKTWLCLYTCCSTRAVHLELVIGLSAVTFIQCFKRFTARRGIPSLMVSDNVKTFKSAAHLIQKVKWKFNLEKAPWHGGLFERLIKSAKRCIKKTIGKSTLTYVELLTVITEVEAVLNSRPISYVSTEDLDEPLTPSHLLMGFRVLSLPDQPRLDIEDPDYDESPSELTHRMKHFLTTVQNFWKRWKTEYLHEPREHHRTQHIDCGDREAVKEGEVAVVFDESHPRMLWRLGKIESVIHSTDGNVRGAVVRTQTKSGNPTLLR